MKLQKRFLRKYNGKNYYKYMINIPPELIEKAREIFINLKLLFGNIAWDDNGNIGKRYRRQDEIGTPYCITVDFDTLEIRR